MLVFGVQQVLGFLLLAKVTLAGQFSFAIQEIDVGEPRGSTEDNLVLALASTTSYGNLSKTYTIGPVEKNNTIKWNNLTLVIEVPTSASNLSIALGVFNNPNGNDDSVTSQ